MAILFPTIPKLDKDGNFVNKDLLDYFKNIQDVMSKFETVESINKRNINVINDGWIGMNTVTLETGWYEVTFKDAPDGSHGTTWLVNHIRTQDSAYAHQIFIRKDDVSGNSVTYMRHLKKGLWTTVIPTFSQLYIINWDGTYSEPVGTIYPVFCASHYACGYPIPVYANAFSTGFQDSPGTLLSGSWRSIGNVHNHDSIIVYLAMKHAY